MSKFVHIDVYTDKKKETIAIYIDDEGEILEGKSLCSPIDEFSLRYGISLAVDRLMKSIEEIKKPIDVGDRVKIIDLGSKYTTYTKWFNDNEKKELGLRYMYGIDMSQINTNDTYTVWAKAPHGNYDKTMVYAIGLAEEGTYGGILLINEKGLKKVK